LKLNSFSKLVYLPQYASDKSMLQNMHVRYGVSISAAVETLEVKVHAVLLRRRGVTLVSLYDPREGNGTAAKIMELGS
jgi:hypothetical protein